MKLKKQTRYTAENVKVLELFYTLKLSHSHQFFMFSFFQNSKGRNLQKTNISKKPQAFSVLCSAV